jgi:hypothetical protein
MIALPCDIMQIFGFSVTDRFFQTQGGVFHIVICMAYVFITIDIEKGKYLSIFSFSAKFIATIFLLLYYILDNDSIIIIISCVGDFIMGCVIYLFYKSIYYDTLT